MIMSEESNGIRMTCPYIRPRALIFVPLIGAFFIDLANNIVIQLTVGWFG